MAISRAGPACRWASIVALISLAVWAVETPPSLSVQEGKQRLAAAPAKPFRCVLRGAVSLPPGVLTSSPGDFYLQDHTGGIAIQSRTALAFEPGDRVEVRGLVSLSGDEIDLTAEQATRMGSGPTVVPRPVSLEDALMGRYDGQLIQVRGRVVQMSTGETRDSLFLGPSKPSLRAYFRRPIEQKSVWPQVAPVGAGVQVVGISIPYGTGEHQIRMRASSDLALLELPARFSAAQIVATVTALICLGLGAVAWILNLRRSVRRKTAEIRELLVQAQEVSRLKSEFLANMSHEIRTPMNAVLGMTELALDTQLTLEQRDHLEAVKSSADGLLHIINDILDFSKIEAGKLELHPVEFSLRGSLAEIMKSLTVRAHQKGLRLAYEVCPGAPDALVGDPGRLSQILVNLAGNAIKFTEQGGVVVRASQEFQTEAEAVLHFSVADTGVGIPKEQQTHIFAPFAQADGSATRRYGGAGLGLSICASLVQMMGGRLWVESQPGQGSTFHFRARFQAGNPRPRADSEEPRDLAVCSQASSEYASELRILLVEDNLLNQRLAQRILEKRGYSVVLAGNGVEALEVLEREGFDLVLMDLQMPEMGGLEAAALIREKERIQGGHIPIIALTAHAMKGDRERCLEAQMDDYISKPFNRSELYAKIEKAVRQPARAAGYSS